MQGKSASTIVEELHRDAHFRDFLPGFVVFPPLHKEGTRGKEKSPPQFAL